MPRTPRMSVEDCLATLNGILRDGQHHTHAEIRSAFGSNAQAWRSRSLMQNSDRTLMYWTGVCKDPTHSHYGRWVAMLTNDVRLGRATALRRTGTAAVYSKKAIAEVRAVIANETDPGELHRLREVERGLMRAQRNLIPQYTSEAARAGLSDKRIERFVERVEAD